MSAFQGKYVISDNGGNYVSYTDDLEEARSLRDDLNDYYYEIDAEGTAAIGCWVQDDQHYTFDRMV